MGRLDHTNTVGGPNPNQRQAAIRPSLLLGIDFARIQRWPGAHATAEHPHAVTDADRRW